MRVLSRLPLFLLILAAAPVLRLLKGAVAGNPQLLDAGNGSCKELADTGAYALAVLPVQALAALVVLAAAIQVEMKIVRQSDSLRTAASGLVWGLPGITGTFLAAAAPRLDSLVLSGFFAVSAAVTLVAILVVALAGWRHWPRAGVLLVLFYMVGWALSATIMIISIGGNGEIPVC